MALSTAHAGIDKLTTGNWATWKFQVRHLLQSRDLFAFVDGSAEKPANDAGGDKKKEYERSVNQAYSVLALAVSTDLVYLICECKDPAAAWTALKGHFERNTLGNKLLLKKRYFRAIMKETSTVESHIKYMKGLTSQLAAIDAPISEEDQVVTLLGSMPDSYSTLITALEARVDDISLEFVQQSLINEELKRQEGRQKPARQPDSALASSSKSKKPVKCFGCGDIGHIRRNCPKYKVHKAKQAGTALDTPSQSYSVNSPQ